MHGARDILLVRFTVRQDFSGVGNAFTDAMFSFAHFTHGHLLKDVLFCVGGRFTAGSTSVAIENREHRI